MCVFIEFFCVSVDHCISCLIWMAFCLVQWSQHSFSNIVSIHLHIPCTHTHTHSIQEKTEAVCVCVNVEIFRKKIDDENSQDSETIDTQADIYVIRIYIFFFVHKAMTEFNNYIHLACFLFA